MLGSKKGNSVLKEDKKKQRFVSEIEMKLH